MKAIITLMMLITTATLFAQNNPRREIIINNDGDTVRITVGDTVKIEDPSKNKSVEVILDDLKEIFGGNESKPMNDEKVIIEEEEEVVVKDKDDNKRTFSLGTDGMKIFKKKKEKKAYIKTNMLMLDWGLNALNDLTDYTSSAAQYMMGGVPSAERNENFFQLKPVKSMNVNLYPILVSLVTKPGKNQRIIFTTGIGFQFYNFKFEEPVSFTESPNTVVYKDTRDFSKNKLGITYATIPLQLTGQTRVGGKRWLTYGAGVMGGYRISSWTKQKSREDGKVKNHDPFNLENTNLCLTGEIGVKGLLRLYGTYQLTNMWQGGLDQAPIAIGIRFFGI